MNSGFLANSGKSAVKRFLRKAWLALATCHASRRNIREHWRPDTSQWARPDAPVVPHDAEDPSDGESAGEPGSGGGRAALAS